MAQLTGGSFKRINASDIKTRRTGLQQLVDVIQEDVSGSATRRTYQVFVTGGVGPGVTSSLYQTVFDQDHTLQTANPLFDMTVGISETSATGSDSYVSTDSANKLLFTSQSLMMREKIDIYKQHASILLGNTSERFIAPHGSTSDSDKIDNALFINFKRLFSRDGIKRETFAIKMNRSASIADDGLIPVANIHTTATGSTIFSDIGAASTQTVLFGGPIGNVVDAGNTSETVGVIFYEKGAVVLDMAKVFSGSQKMSGTIPAMSNQGSYGMVSDTIAAGGTILGNSQGNYNAKFIPDFMVSGSIDAIVDHIASTRFQSGTLTAMTFQNQTNINSTLIFCRATADEFNFSSNPTFTDSTGKIVVIDTGQEDTQRAFTFPTTVGLHDQFGNLLAIAKLSRPIEKNDEKDMTFRIRLDF